MTTRSRTPLWPYALAAAALIVLQVAALHHLGQPFIAAGSGLSWV